jgi:glycosyltransferase involved in cell wall biosynthesis
MDAADNVVFHGQVSQSQLADLMRRSAVFVLPSFYEGLPLVLVEAAACGCRLVATALPGVVDPLKRELGDSLELVPLPRLENTDQPVADDLPQFVDDLARAIAISLERPGLDDTHQIVAGMTWSSVYARIETIWRRVIEFL